LIFAHGIRWHGKSYDDYLLGLGPAGSLDTLVAQILDLLPDTATLPPIAPEATPAAPGLLGDGAVVVAALAAAAALEMRRRRPRPSR
jgi:hypothetical protein